MKAIYFFIGCLFFFSCNKEDDVLKETTIVNKDEINIKISETSSELTIEVEDLLNIDDNRNNASPDNDFFYIVFDANNNNSIDGDIDFGLGSPSLDNDMCSFYFKSEEALSGCGAYETAAIFSSDFRASDLSSTPHIIWIIKIPKDEFPDDRIDFNIKTYNKGIFTDYPKSNLPNTASFTFMNLFSLEW